MTATPRKPRITFPENPFDGQQVTEIIDNDSCVIWTYRAEDNSWVYQIYGLPQDLIYTDQVLVRDQAVAPMDGEEDAPVLQTQKDINHYLDSKAPDVGDLGDVASKEWVGEQGFATEEWTLGEIAKIEGGGGAPGKESLPWIQINSWGMRRSNYGSSPIYECQWYCNQNAMHTWQYEIDVDGDGNWIDIAEHPQKDDLGFSPGGEFPNQLTLSNTGQEERYPNALMRYRITAELNSIMSELSSGAIAAWEVRRDVYDPPLYETGVAADLEPYATTEYVDEKVEDCLPLTGGTVTGELTVAGSFQVNGPVTGDFAMNGHKITGLGDPTADAQAANKRYVDAQIGAIEIPEAGGGSLGFTKKYDGNKFYKPGLSTESLDDGDVMFLSNGASTTMFAAVTHVGLPESEYDWDKFTGIGTIKVKNGGTTCGYLQVISATNNPGRNWLVKVKVLDVETNDLEPESGHPCYFNGMFIE